MSEAVTIRAALVGDVPAICDLINHYAELGKMLHRSRESTYRSLRDFLVAEAGDGEIIGCAAVTVFWADLAEVRSLAISPANLRAGVGARLLTAGVDSARQLGIKRMFTLTYEQEFFGKNGFEIIDRQSLPEKVWGACISCPKADACDEIAMMLSL